MGTWSSELGVWLTSRYCARDPKRRRQSRAVREKIESGLYNNASEVIREALRLTLKHEAENDWLKREEAIGFAQLEAGETVKVSSKREFEEILADPERWRRRADLFPGCQIAAQGKHVILCRVEESVLQVARVLHAAMDYRRDIPGGADGM